MTLLKLLAFLSIVVGLFVALGLTPERVAQDILSILNRPRSMKWRVRMTKKQKREGWLEGVFRRTQNALTASERGGLFAGICMASFLLFVAGVVISVMIGNFILLPPLAIILAGIPFLYAHSVAAAYQRLAREEMETALSIVTTAYLRSDNLEQAVAENIAHIKPPLQGMFAAFLQDCKTNPDMKSAIRKLRRRYDNAVWFEWCDVLLDCQDDGYQKSTLLPIVGKLTDIRLVNSELDNLCYTARRNYSLIIIMLFALLPGLYVMRKSWFYALIATDIGKVILAGALMAVAVTYIVMLRLSKPIEYKR